MTRFTLFRQGRLERSFSVDADEIKIGRLPGMDITLATPTVSRQHARIRREGTAYYLEDAGSVNGVFVKGRRVSMHALSPGDSILIEDYTLVFEPPEEVYKPGEESAASGNDHPTRDTFDPNMTHLNIGRFLPKDH